MKFSGFKKFIESIGGGSYLSTSWSGTEADPSSSLAGHPTFLPGLDFAMGYNPIEIPNTKTDGIVKHFSFRTNPIMIELENGTKIVMDFNQYKNIEGDLPVVPKFTSLVIHFQRRPEDNKSEVSKIVKCIAKFVGPSYLKASYGIKKKCQMPSTTPG